MRRSWLSILGAALWLAAPNPLPTMAAEAGPAYTADTVIGVFSKVKAQKQLLKTRKICFEGDPGCEKTPPAPTTFDLLVNFEFNSDRLTSATRENLAQFAKALLDPRLKGTKFEVDGHTDATGAEDYNQGLSERRAKAVVDYLASLGVDPQTLAAHGFGKSKPRVGDPYSPQNRRVETHMID